LKEEENLKEVMSTRQKQKAQTRQKEEEGGRKQEENSCIENKDKKQHEQQARMQRKRRMDNCIQRQKLRSNNNLYSNHELHKQIRTGWLKNRKEAVKSILEWIPPVIRYFLRPTMWWQKDVMQSFALMVKQILVDNKNVFIVANSEIGIKEFLSKISFEPEVYNHVYQFVYIQDGKEIYWALLEIIKDQKSAFIHMMTEIKREQELWDFLYDLLEATTWQEDDSQFICRMETVINKDTCALKDYTPKKYPENVGLNFYDPETCQEIYHPQDCGPILCNHLYDCLYSNHHVPEISETLDKTMSIRSRVLKSLLLHTSQNLDHVQVLNKMTPTDDWKHLVNDAAQLTRRNNFSWIDRTCHCGYSCHCNSSVITSCCLQERHTSHFLKHYKEHQDDKF